MYVRGVVCSVCAHGLASSTPVGPVGRSTSRDCLVK